MSHVSAALLLGALSFGSGFVRAQEGVLNRDPARGAALLAEARKATGGEDKLRAVKTLEAKGSVHRTAGNNQIQGDLDLFIQTPDKMRRDEDLSIPGGPSVTTTQVLNGTEVWDENSGGNGFRFGGPGGFGGGGGRGGGRGGFGGGDGQRRDRGAAAPGAADQGGQGRGNIDPEQLRQLQVRQRQGELSRLMLAWLLTTDAPVAWVGTAESPDGKADVLEVTPADGTPTRLFLDTSSHLPLMLTWQGPAPQLFTRRGGPGRGNGQAGAPNQNAQPDVDNQGAPNQETPRGGQTAADGTDQPRRGGGQRQATLRMTLADYKAVNGIMLPHTITRGVNGQTNEEWTIKSYKINPTLKPKTFTK